MKPSLERRHSGRKSAAITAGILCLLMVLSFLLGSYRLGDESLWEDELYTVDYASAPLASFLTTIHDKNTPPLYYVIMAVWVHLFGVSEAALRMPSVIFGVLCIPCMYLLGSLLYDRRTGIVSSALLATTRFFVSYQQEARSYELFLLLSIASSCAFIWLLRRPAWRAAACYALLCALGFYTHYLFPLIIGAHILLALAHLRALRASLLQIAVSSGTAIIIALPWYLFSFMPQILNPQGPSGLDWIREPTPGIVIATFGEMIGHDFSKFITGSLLILILGAYLFFAVVNQKARLAAVRREIFTITLLIILPACVFLISFIKPLWVPRYLIFALIGIALALARLIHEVRMRVLQAAIILIILLGNVASMQGYYESSEKTDMRSAGEYIAKNYVREDRVLVYQGGAMLISYYLPDVPEYRIAYIPKIAPGTAKNSEYIRSRVADGHDIFIVYLAYRLGLPASRNGYLGDELRSIDPQLRLSDTQQFNKVIVEHYVRSPGEGGEAPYERTEDAVQVHLFTEDAQMRTYPRQEFVQSIQQDILGSSPIVVRDFPGDRLRGGALTGNGVRELRYEGQRTYASLTLPGGEYFLRAEVMSTPPSPTDIGIEILGDRYTLTLNGEMLRWHTVIIPFDSDGEAGQIGIALIKDMYLEDKGNVIYDKNIYVKGMSILAAKADE